MLNLIYFLVCMWVCDRYILPDTDAEYKTYGLTERIIMSFIEAILVPPAIILEFCVLIKEKLEHRNVRS